MAQAKEIFALQEPNNGSVYDTETEDDEAAVAEAVVDVEEVGDAANISNTSTNKLDKISPKSTGVNLVSMCVKINFNLLH